MDQPEWIDNGKKYLHVFTDSSTDKEKGILVLDNAEVSYREITFGHAVFERDSQKQIELAEGDHLIDQE